MRVGNKKIFHLEAWVVKVMSLYKVSASRGRSCAAPALPSPRIWPGTDLSLYLPIATALRLRRLSFTFTALLPWV